MHFSFTEKIRNSNSNITKEITDKLSYQREEYLGDSLLNFTVSELVYFETANCA
jgi:hypothetical protein